jgi:hypothetical protein
MQAILFIIAVLAGITMWACGMGFGVSIIALILKWCGASFVAGMSGWLPVKLLGGWILSLVVASLATIGVATIH